MPVDGDDRSETQRIDDVARQIGASNTSVRNWVRQAEIDEGLREGIPTAAQARIAELEDRCAELETTVEILKAAASFFAREYDPQSKRATGSSASTTNGSESYRSAER
jgi:transposase-like protein